MQTRIRMIAHPLSLAAALAVAQVASGHDFWIEPTTFHPKSNEVVHVGLRVGHLGEAEKVGRKNDRIERFEIIGPSGKLAIVGVDGESPAGVVRPVAAGIYCIAYQNTPSMHEMEPEAFRAYLGEEGLDEPLRSTGADLQRTRPYREAYSRCAKALIAVDGGLDQDVAKPVGLDLELVPLENPYGAGSSDALSFQLFFQGRPVANALVGAMALGNPTGEQTVRSDDAGRVTFRIGRPDIWLIHAVHMVKASESGDAEWRSYWASLTFDTSQPAPPGQVDSVTSRP
jgi:uncharacterized GH25 family protein